MRRLFLVGMMMIAATAFAKEIPALMPMPASVHYGQGRFVISDSFTLGLDGAITPRIEQAARRFLRRLDDRTALFLKHPEVVDAGFSCLVKSGRSGALKVGEDESYSISIDESGIVIQAATDIGALYGLETLLQLLMADDEGFYFPHVKIEDSPRFAWRGLMIDASRHWMPVDVILRNLDAMAAVKLNVMHWHLSEDQGFRVECKSHPRLHEMGSDGLYYTQQQIRDIIDYAALRGIRVVPEFDMPGHATSWLVGYPELGSKPGPYTIERRWGIMDPVMDPTRETTYKFLDAFIDEMCALFPDDYFHIGGDENNGRQWDASEAIVKYKKKHKIEDNSALQAEFNKRILAMLTANGKKMIGWDEIFHERMPKDIVIHSWRGREAMVEAAKQGYMTILSNGYYIDLMQKTSFHYLNDPCPSDIGLTDVEKKRILGGEATMWSEYVNVVTVDSRIWPRTAAIAERFWSPENVKDVADLFKRLDVISVQLEEHGLTHIKNRSMMLRRLCRTRDIHPMLTFLGTVEPVEVYQRGAQKRHYQYSPLTRSVDIALAEAADANAFNAWVKGIMEHDMESLMASDGMKALLARWQANDKVLQKMAERAPALKEVLPLSGHLAQLSTLALEALETLKNHDGKRDPAWLEKAQPILKAARDPHGQLELQIVDSVEALVNAAGQ